MENTTNEELGRYLDEEGKITAWPSKLARKILVLEYLAQKFEAGKDYREKEVNAIIDEWHTFGDYFLLRRGLVDYKLLSRTRDGSKYWRGEKEAVLPEDPKCLCAVLEFKEDEKPKNE